MKMYFHRTLLTSCVLLVVSKPTVTMAINWLQLVTVPSFSVHSNDEPTKTLYLLVAYLSTLSACLQGIVNTYISP